MLPGDCLIVTIVTSAALVDESALLSAILVSIVIRFVSNIVN